MVSIFIAFKAHVFSGFGQLEHLKLSLFIEQIISDILKWLQNFSYGHDKFRTVLYPLKFHSAIHTLGMLKYSQFLYPARQELVGRLVMWGAKILEAKSRGGPW